MHGRRPIRAIENELRYLAQELAEAIAFADALVLAFQERTGQPPDGGCHYIEQDYDRAEEILLLYPEIDA